MRKMIVCMCLTGLLASGAALAADKKPATAPSWLEKHFARLDGNHDGKLSEKEYLAHWKHKKRGAAAYKAMDADHNGEVSFAEYKGYRAKMAKARAKAKRAKMVKTKAEAKPTEMKKP